MTAGRSALASLAGLTRDELLHEAVVAPRQARGDYPDSRVVDRPDWFQLLTPSFRDGGLNEVALARLADDEADAAIDRTLAEYAALGLRFRWIVGPDSRPLDLADRLARRGMRCERVRVMVAAVADLRVDAPADIEVVDVGPHNLELYARTIAAGWAMDPAPLLDHLRHLFRAQGAHRCYLALRDGQPAGAANHFLLPRSLFFMGAVVLPEHRGRGVYRALLAARLRAAGSAAVVATHARADTSAPILERLGFRDLVELPFFFNR